MIAMTNSTYKKLIDSPINKTVFHGVITKISDLIKILLCYTIYLHMYSVVKSK